MKAFLGQLFRILLGIGLLPFGVGYGLAFADQLAVVRQVQSAELSFLLGITGYLAFHALVAAPTRAYVFGHEMTHAIAAWASGGKVKAIKVGAKSGSVKTDKINVFTALAPYLIPGYVVLWALLFGAAGLFWQTYRWMPGFFFGLGAALAFHLVFTINVLKQKQPDLEIVGPVLGLALIFIVNLVVVAGMMALIVPEIRFWPYLQKGFQYTQDVYGAVFNQLFEL